MSYSSSSSDSISDFAFHNPRNLEHELSSADELFANGVILPVQIQKKNVPPGIPSKWTANDALPFPPLPPIGPSSVKNIITSSEEKPHSKSFWGFKRSASVNADVGTNKRGFLFSLPILPRSHSTGSVQYPRRTAQRRQKSTRIAKPGCTSWSSSTSIYANPIMQKSSSRKNNNVHYDGVVHVSPVLNVSPSCISKGAANLFGFNCFLPKGKDKRSKR